MDVFAGLDDIGWHRMNHAYGPATELPELVRGLVDPDPAVREVALDGMYGAVHHQGDVYRCTLEAIPFLVRLAAAFDLPGRHKVVELLASIGGVNFDASPNRDQDRDGSDDDGRCVDDRH